MIEAEYEIIHLPLMTNEQIKISDLKSMFLATKLRLVWCISSNNESNDIHSLS
jgi:hypothetical protein